MGGEATAVSTIVGDDRLGIISNSLANGGSGGAGLDGADGGNGGGARSALTITDVTPAGTGAFVDLVRARATGGAGGASSGGRAGNGGDAMATLEMDVSGSTGDDTFASAVGGASPGAAGGDAIARASLVKQDGGNVLVSASAVGGTGSLGGTGGSGGALAEAEGATGGSVNATAFAGDERGIVRVAATSSAAGTGIAGTAAGVGEIGSSVLAALASAQGEEASNLHLGIAAPDIFATASVGPAALSASPPQVYGAGIISIISGGTGTPMTYGGEATYTFRAGTMESLFLDFVPFALPLQFESLSFVASLNGIEVLNTVLDTPMAALDFFDRQHALGSGQDGSDSEFRMSYSFVANAADQGFGALYSISNIPVAPIPVPAALPLLLGALAALGALARRGRRRAA
jgi:hypothetical protein